MKYVSLIILSILMLGCRSTKNTVETHTSSVNDSIRLSSLIRTDTVQSIVKIIYVPAVATLNVNSPCDSLGNLKPVNISTSAGNFRATITSIGNNLKIKIQEIDSLISTNEKLTINTQQKDSIIKSLTIKKADFKSTKIVKYRPTKWTYIFFAIALLEAYFLFGNPKKLITKIFKKQIS